MAEELTDEEIAIIATFGGLSFLAITGPILYLTFKNTFKGGAEFKLLY